MRATRRVEADGRAQSRWRALACSSLGALALPALATNQAADWTSLSADPLALMLGVIAVSFFARKRDPEPEPFRQGEPSYEELKAALATAQAERAALQIDLHECKNVQEASLRRFQAMFYELPLPCFTINEIGHVMEWNKAAAAFFGQEEHQVTDKPIADVLGKEIFRGDAEGAIYLVFMGQYPEPSTLTLTLPDGSTRKAKWYISPVKNRQGQVVGALNTLGILPRAATSAEDQPSQAA